MMGKALPFQFTTPIVRYLKAITQAYEKKLADLVDANLALPLECVIDSYLEDEYYMTDSEENRKKFNEFFEQQKYAHFQDSPDTNNRLVDNDVKVFKTKEDVFFAKGEAMDFPVTFRAVILTIAPFYDAYNQYLTDKQPSQSNLVMLEKLACKYNKDTGRLSYGDNIQHSFQKRGGSAYRKRIFELLWNRRRHEIKNGKEVILNGNRITIDEISENLKLRKSSDIEVTIDNVINTLKAKGFSVHLNKSGKSFLFVVKEV